MRFLKRLVLIVGVLALGALPVHSQRIGIGIGTIIRDIFDRNPATLYAITDYVGYKSDSTFVVDDFSSPAYTDTTYFNLGVTDPAEDGTITHPYDNWSDVISGTIPDSTVYYLKYGCYENLPNQAPAWTSGLKWEDQKWIKIEAYGDPADGLPKLEGQLAGSRILRFNTCEYVTIRNIEILGSAITTSCITVANDDNNHYIIDGVYAHNVNKCFEDFSATTGVDSIVFANCIFTNTRDDGLFIQRPGKVEVTNHLSDTVNTAWTPPAEEEATSGGDNIQFAVSLAGTDIDISYSTLRHGATGNKQCIILNGVAGNLGNIDVYNCLLRLPYDDGDGNWGVGVYVGYADTARIYNNYFVSDSVQGSFNNGIVARTADQVNIIEYNIMQFDTIKALVDFEGDNTTIYNNTFVWDTAITSGLVTIGDVNVRNNIFYSTNGSLNSLSVGGGSTIDYNCHYPNKDADDAGVNSVTGDPVFADVAELNFRISTTSPAKEVGVNVGIATDLEGVAVSDPPNMGIAETEEN